MDDKTPNNENTPHTDPASADRAPESTPDSPTVPFTPTDAPAPAAPAGPAPPGTTPAGTTPAGAAPLPEASAAYPATPGEAPKRGRKRALLIGGGIAAAVLLAGGGVAVGAAMADEFGDDHDDRPSAVDGPRHEQGDRDDRGEGQPPQGGPQQGGPQQGGPQQGGPQRGGPVTGIGTDSADELVDIADAARGAADGDVTSIDAKRDGSWEVTLETAAGDESEVRVDADLAATVVSTETADDGDTGPAAALDEEAIRALVAAALDEAEGMITDLDVDDDSSRPYDVSVVTEDRRSIDIDLDASFAVVATDTDD
ncbi:hypothetical protein [uncultured Microbacterium sp.]|uniref:hypothetical protein n=1 Tax=uncultured Microbacterium sp. TaxID=191216 RepID=UPI0028DCB106|nr:hypothetical protein [uncultured Microbacterium sp.]